MIRNVRIRAAGLADTEAISQVLQACGLLDNDINHTSRLYHVALLGDKVVGCASGEQYGGTVAIESVAVLREYQGRQIATHLLGAVLMRARANGCTKATVLTAEHPGFFARFGFALTSLNGLPKELQLSKEFLRRFGARTHYMCRRLD